MYEEQFKKWGLYKYSKKTKKHEMNNTVLCDTQTRSMLSNLDINKDDNRNYLKYSQEMDPANAIDPGTFWRHSTGRNLLSQIVGMPSLIAASDQLLQRPVTLLQLWVPTEF